MAEEMWRWADPNGQQRRVRLDELRAALAGGVIAPNTPVWRSGWTAWQPAHDVPELSTSALSAANGVMLNIPPPPLAVVAVQHEFEASSVPPPAVDEDEPPPPPAYVPMPVRPVTVPPPPGSSAKNLGDPSSSKKVLSAAKAAESSPKVADAAKPPLPAGAGPSKPPPPVPKSIKPPPPAGASGTPEPAAAAPALGKSMGTMLMFGGAGSGDQPDAAPAPAPAPDPPRVNAQSQSNIPTVIGGAPPPLEEISSSMLLEAAESQPKLPASGPIGPDGLPPATDPIRRSTPDEDEEPAGVPGARSSRRGLVSLAGDLAAVKPKNKFVLPVFAVLGGLLAIAVLGGIVSVVRSVAGGKDGDKEDPKKLASSSTASATTTTSSAAAATSSTATAATSGSASGIVAPTTSAGAGDKPATVAAYDTCKMQGSTHVVAPRAMVAVGVEVGSTPQGHLVGFASTFKEAMGVMLDPTSMGATATEKAVSPDIIKRVVPGTSGGKVVPAVDADKRGDVMTHRRASSNLAVDMGVAEGHLVWAPRLGQSHAKLFKLPGTEPIEALRIVPLQNEKGYAFAFRQGSNVVFGAARGDSMLAPAGELRVVAGLGKVVGSPAIAVSDDTIMVAWADRAAPVDPWTIRLSHAKVGEGGEVTSIFSTPSGGAGGKTMAPALAPLGGKKYLLAWTEGPAKSNQVRATVIGGDGAPSGEAMLLSPAGTNAGQAQVAVGEGGKAVAAFLAERGKRYEVTAVSLLCEKK